MAFFGIMLMFGALYLLMAFVLWVIEVVGKWQVYRKLGIPSWKCLIPYYNNYVEFKRVWEVNYFIIWLVASICLIFLPALTDDIGLFMRLLVLAVTLLQYAVYFVFCMKMAEVFQKGIGWAAGLFFLPFVFYPILGFSRDMPYGDTRNN